VLSSKLGNKGVPIGVQVTRTLFPHESSQVFSSSNDDVFSLMTKAYAVHVDLVH
jgi:hypothetical protein